MITAPNVRNCLEKRYDFDLSTIHFVFNFSNDDLNNSAIPLPVFLEGKSTLFSAKSHLIVGKIYVTSKESLTFHNVVIVSNQ